MATEEVFLSEKGLLKKLPISRRTLYAWRLRGLPYVKIGGRVLFDWVTVRAWMLRQQRGE